MSSIFDTIRNNVSSFPKPFRLKESSQLTTVELYFALFIMSFLNLLYAGVVSLAVIFVPKTATKPSAQSTPSYGSHVAPPLRATAASPQGDATAPTFLWKTVVFEATTPSQPADVPISNLSACSLSATTLPKAITYKRPTRPIGVPEMTMLPYSVRTQASKRPLHQEPTIAGPPPSAQAQTIAQAPEITEPSSAAETQIMTSQLPQVPAMITPSSSAEAQATACELLQAPATNILGPMPTHIPPPTSMAIPSPPPTPMPALPVAAPEETEATGKAAPIPFKPRRRGGRKTKKARAKRRAEREAQALAGVWTEEVSDEESE